MAYKKGFGGRKKGSQNRVPVELKAMIRGALDKAGGMDYLLTQANKNPVAFMSLLGRIIPQELKHDGAIGTYDAVLTEKQKQAGIDAIMRYQLKHKEIQNVIGT